MAAEWVGRDYDYDYYEITPGEDDPWFMHLLRRLASWLRDIGKFTTPGGSDGR